MGLIVIVAGVVACGVLLRCNRHVCIYLHNDTTQYLFYFLYRLWLLERKSGKDIIKNKTTEMGNEVDGIWDTDNPLSSHILINNNKRQG